MPRLAFVFLLVAASCSSILGLDEFVDQTDTSVASSSGASGSGGSASSASGPSSGTGGAGGGTGTGGAGGGCQSPSDCDDPGECASPSCLGGMCDSDLDPSATPCMIGATPGVCDASGQCVQC